MPRMNFLDRKKLRHEHAEIRNSEYNALTTEQKIARAESRPGNSAKELERLHASTD